jgi:hypothetical protein
MPLTEARGGEVRSAFMRGPKERPPRLVVDHERIALGGASELLAGFVGHRNVEMWSTRNDGRPHLQVEWIPRSDDQVQVHWTSNAHKSLSGVWSASQYRQAAREAVRHRRAAEEGAAYRELILAAACSERRIDALVTDSAFLLDRPWGVRGDSMPPAAAVASLGLFLRLRGDLLMAEQTEKRDALELVALLRNSVHGEPFTPIARQRAGQIHKYIQLPEDDTPPFLAAVGRRGGDAVWGIHPVAATPAGSCSRPTPTLRRCCPSWRAASTL